MALRQFILAVVFLLAASSVFANPIKLWRAEGLATREILNRDILTFDDAVAQFKTHIGTIQTNLGTIGGANVSTIDTTQKATNDLKTSYDNFHASLEALKSAKQAHVVEPNSLFGECNAVKDVGAIIKDVMVLVNFIKSAIGGDSLGASEIINAVLTTLSFVTQDVPSLLSLTLSICSPF